MTTNQPPSVPVQPSQYNSIAQPLGGFDHLPGVDSTGTYPTVNYVDPPTPTRCTGAGGEYYDPPYQATGPAALRGNLEGHTPGITQCIPFTAGPPRLELYGPPIPDVHNDYPPSQKPLPHNIAVPSRGNSTGSLVHPRLSATEDLKNMAIQYLHNPGSHVDRFQIRRSRSGVVEVLILLGIDDTM
ncbi:hypothetical protein BJV77DRAFT_1024585 [Russula vinacea]|nr:hypothetical protein BJV77DRAFT_1024585 [Russula vinacea]